MSHPDDIRSQLLEVLSSNQIDLKKMLVEELKFLLKVYGDKTRTVSYQIKRSGSASYHLKKTIPLLLAAGRALIVLMQSSSVLFS